MNKIIKLNWSRTGKREIAAVTPFDEVYRIEGKTLYYTGRSKSFFVTLPTVDYLEAMRLAQADFEGRVKLCLSAGQDHRCPGIDADQTFLLDSPAGGGERLEARPMILEKGWRKNE